MHEAHSILTCLQTGMYLQYVKVTQTMIKIVSQSAHRMCSASTMERVSGILGGSLRGLGRFQGQSFFSTVRRLNGSSEKIKHEVVRTRKDSWRKYGKERIVSDRTEECMVKEA